MNSYGKTWHTWMTGTHNQQADPLPFGPPDLQWSFNRDGEAPLATTETFAPDLPAEACLSHTRDESQD
jgi:hypothetical protein